MILLRTNRIYFIVSLSGRDRESAADLYNYHLKNSINYPSEYHEIEKKVDLFSLLDKINEAIIKFNVYPLIHIESHGLDTGDGLYLNSEESVYWKELTGKLTEINTNCCNNLMLCISACNVVPIVQELINSCYKDFETKAPFFSYLGPESEITTEDLFSAYSNFYKKLDETKNFEIALNYMNQFTKVRFRSIDCYNIFMMGYKHSEKEWIEKRYKIISSDQRRIYDLLNIFINLYGLDFRCKEAVIKILNDEQFFIDYMNKKMDCFLMINRCEMNKTRFPRITKLENFKESIDLVNFNIQENLRLSEIVHYL